MFKSVVRAISIIVLGSASLAFLTTGLTIQATNTSSSTVYSRLAATHNFGGSTSTVVGNSNTLYYSRGADLVIADITNPHEPIDLGLWSGQDKSHFFNAHLDNTRLYLPRSSFAGIEVLDVSNPIKPIKISNIPPLYIEGRAYLPTDIATSGNYAFVLQNQLFRVIDMSSPELPTDTTYFEPSGDSLNAIALSGNHAYVGDNSGVSIVDISSPVAPSAVGRIALPWTRHVEISGNLLYVGTAFAVHIMDISVPTDPVEVGVFQPHSSYMISQLTTFDNYIYVSSYTDDLT